MERAFWQGRRVLVTGHTGFKGSWLCLWLQSLGAKVAGFALAPPAQSNLFTALGLHRTLDSTLADIRDPLALTACVQRLRPQVVFHLAAQPLVRRALAEPAATFAVNVMGTVNLLEALRRQPELESVVVVTSDKVYHNREWLWGYRESDPLGGREPYGVSKACCELVVDGYRDAFLAAKEVGIATVRAGNVIGGGDWAEDRLIPDAARAFCRGRPLRIRHPQAVRPWQHVLEPVRGYLQLARRLSEDGASWSGPWNFGPVAEDARPVSQVADQLVRLWGPGARWELESAVQPYEARLLAVDSSKAINRLGWQPRWRLEEGLTHTVDWYRAAARDEDLATLSRRQLEIAQDG